jgi:hypothetical protein
MKLRYAWPILLASSIALARGLTDTPPKGVDLNGTWQLNTALSDDAHKIVEEERARHQPRRERIASQAPAPDAGPVAQSAPVAGARPRVRYRRRDGLDELLIVPDRLTIEHAGSRVAFITPQPAGGERRIEYRAGTTSVISVRNGVADREVGWNRRGFVISTRPVDGLQKQERYELDKEGRLLYITEVRGEEIRRLVITRVYDLVIPSS